LSPGKPKQTVSSSGNKPRGVEKRDGKVEHFWGEENLQGLKYVTPLDAWNAGAGWGLKWMVSD